MTLCYLQCDFDAGWSQNHENAFQPFQPCTLCLQDLNTMLRTLQQHLARQLVQVAKNTQHGNTISPAHQIIPTNPKLIWTQACKNALSSTPSTPSAASRIHLGPILQSRRTLRTMREVEDWYSRASELMYRRQKGVWGCHCCGGSLYMYHTQTSAYAHPHLAHPHLAHPLHTDADKVLYTLLGVNIGVFFLWQAQPEIAIRHFLLVGVFYLCI